MSTAITPPVRFPIAPLKRAATACFVAASLTACSQPAPPEASIEVAAKGIHAAALANDASLAVIGSINHGGSLWNLTEGERLFDWNHRQGDRSLLLSADISPDSNWAVTADANTLVLWDTRSGTAERFWSAPGRIVDVSLNRGATRALLALDTDVTVLFDVRRGGIISTLQHQGEVEDATLSADGTRALTGSADYTARFWNLATSSIVSRVEHEDDVQLVALSPDGSLALSASKYDKVVLWRTDSGEITGEIPLSASRLKRGLRFTAAAISQDNARLLTGRPNGVVELWDLASLNKIQQWRLPKRETLQPTGTSVLDLAFANDTGSFYAVASNGFIHTLGLKNKTAGSTDEPAVLEATQ